MLRIVIQPRSPLLLGSGASPGTYIDLDITTDDLGLPLFPARRLKGLLRESAMEVVEMLESSGQGSILTVDVDQVFGVAKAPGVFSFYDLRPDKYRETRQALLFYHNRYGDLVNPEAIVNSLTDIRQQTAINEKGYAEENSLRVSRVLKAPIEFSGPVMIGQRGFDDQCVAMLALACANLRRAGAGRNRGYGQVACRLEYRVHSSDPWIDLNELVLEQLCDQEGSQFHLNLRTPGADDTSSRTGGFQGDGRGQGNSSGFSHTLPYQLNNLSPLVITSQEGDENIVRTLEYIPGRLLHGYFAGEYIRCCGLNNNNAHKDPVFRKWFLDGDLQFLDALPAAQMGDEIKDCRPVPLFWGRNKSDTVVHCALDDSSAAAKPIGGYGWIHENELSTFQPETELHFHLVRNSSRGSDETSLKIREANRIQGHGEDGDIFNYESLVPGQDFTGRINGSESDLRDFASLFFKRADDFPQYRHITIGRSVHTQYGLVRMMAQGICLRTKPSAGNYWPEAAVNPEAGKDRIKETDIIMFLESPLVVVNQWGYPAIGEKEILDALIGHLGEVNGGSPEVVSSRLRIEEGQGFRSNWKLRLPLYRGVSAGSYLLLRFPGGISTEIAASMARLEMEGMGEKRSQGCGQVRFWKTIPRVDSYRTTAASQPVTLEGNKADRGLAADILSEIIQDRIKELVVSTAISRACGYHSHNKRRLNNSLLGRLQAIVRDSSSPDMMAQAVVSLRDTAASAVKSYYSQDGNLFQHMTTDWKQPKIARWCEKTDTNEPVVQKLQDLAADLEPGQALDFESLYILYFTVLFRTLRKLNNEADQRDARAGKEAVR